MRFVVALLVAFVLWPVVSHANGQGPCTDGVDCYCDTVTDPNIVSCEDWELADWYEDDAATDWSTAPGGNPDFRGGAGPFQSRFGAIGTPCAWVNGEPSATPDHGPQCGESVCAAAAEWRADDRYEGNDFGTCFDIQRTGDVDAEVAGLTLSGGYNDGDVFAGSTYLGQRVSPGYESAGKATIAGPFTTTMGFTMARAYSTNLLTAGAGSSDGWITPQWKGEQTTGGLQFPEGNTGGNCTNPPFSGGNVNISSEANCNTAVAGADIKIGNVHCQSPAFRHCAAAPGDCDANPNCDTTNEFDIQTDWPLGTWGCVRAYVDGVGTSDVEMWIEFQGPSDSEPRRIFWIDELDSDLVWGSGKEIGSLEFDAYYNGFASASETFYRYMDNVTVTDDLPVSCESIGFTAEAAPSLPPVLIAP